MNVNVSLNVTHRSAAMRASEHKGSVLEVIDFTCNYPSSGQ